MIPKCTKNPLGSTHTRELDTAVTALGSGTLLLDVQVTEVTTGGLDDADTVGPRVVPIYHRMHVLACIFFASIVSEIS